MIFPAVYPAAVDGILAPQGLRRGVLPSLCGIGSEILGIV